MRHADTAATLLSSTVLLCCVVMCCAVQPPADPAAAAAAEAVERAQLGHKIERLLKHVTRENLVDLLQMTITYQPMIRAKIASEVLLKYDQQHMRLLHPTKAAAASGQPVGAAQGAMEVSKGPMQDLILTRLLHACAAAGNSAVTKYLTKLPAAEETREWTNSLASLQCAHHSCFKQPRQPASCFLWAQFS